MKRKIFAIKGKNKKGTQKIPEEIKRKRKRRGDEEILNGNCIITGGKLNK